MFANGQPVKTQPLLAGMDANDRKVGRAAAHVADQNQLPVVHLFLPISFVSGKPGVEGSQRLFQENGVSNTGLFGSSQG